VVAKTFQHHERWQPGFNREPRQRGYAGIWQEIDTRSDSLPGRLCAEVQESKTFKLRLDADLKRPQKQ
jgi:hypothetical protein